MMEASLSNGQTQTHCVKIVRIRSYSGPYFPAFGLNMERYSAHHHIQSECGKIRTRITLYTITFYALIVAHSLSDLT